MLELKLIADGLFRTPPCLCSTFLFLRKDPSSGPVPSCRSLLGQSGALCGICSSLPPCQVTLPILDPPSLCLLCWLLVLHPFPLAASSEPLPWRAHLFLGSI